MKTGLLVASTCCLYSSLLFSANIAWSQCVQADVSAQINISGTKNLTNRRNNVTMENSGPCTGNASVTTGTQVNVGGEVEQHRNVRHRTEGGSGNGTNIDGPNFQNGVNIQSDVYNSADNFEPKVEEETVP